MSIYHTPVHIFQVSEGTSALIGPKRERVRKVATIQVKIGPGYMKSVEYEVERIAAIIGAPSAAYTEYDGVYDHIIGYDPRLVAA